MSESLTPPFHALGRTLFVVSAVTLVVGVAAVGAFWSPALWAYLVVGPFVALGVWDMTQEHHAILRNYPVLGHVRYIFEAIRPEIQQYFVEQNLEGRPLNRQERSVVYARSKRQLDTTPFGTQRNVYDEGHEWMNHSLCPVQDEHGEEQPRIRIGGSLCSQPYEASVLNISAMSYGSLSHAAIRALNAGAARGGFFHNTGEGGCSPYHLEPGGDLCWQLGTGYFGCRTEGGRFDGGLFQETARHPNVKLIELKLSQGAKPGKGGILPAAKITPEIARIRRVPMGQDVISPPSHLEFDTPIGLLEFIQRLRELSGGKPVGFKLCMGKRREFFAICKAMRETGIRPDFITVDGAEGGTGAAPLEFSNFMGTPLVEGLVTAHNGLVGFGLRDEVKIIASGGVMTGFSIAKRLAIGADVCLAARAFMLSLGCIQALRCHLNDCPAGVATQDPRLVGGLVVTRKSERVFNFHRDTVKTFMALLYASGVAHPSDLRPWHIHRRVSQFEVRHYGEMFHYLEPGELLGEELPAAYVRAVRAASPFTFAHAALAPPLQAVEALGEAARLSA